MRRNENDLEICENKFEVLLVFGLHAHQRLIVD